MQDISIVLMASFVFVLLHMITVLLCTRTFEQVAPVIFHALSALIYLFCLVTLRVIIRFDLWATFCIFSFCVSAYLFAFGVIYKSLSIRFLIAAISNHGGISVRDLEIDYCLPTFLERVDLLVKMDNVKEQEGYYQLTEMGMSRLNLLENIRKTFRIKAKAFYYEGE